MRLGKSAESRINEVTDFEHVLEATDDLAQLALNVDVVVEAHGGWPDAFLTTNEGVA